MGVRTKAYMFHCWFFLISGRLKESSAYSNILSGKISNVLFMFVLLSEEFTCVTCCEIVNVKILHLQ